MAETRNNHDTRDFLSPESNEKEQLELREISEDELEQILHDHKKWLLSKSNSGNKANLCGFNLYRKNLNRANLQGAYLRRAHLPAADLAEANLQEVDLQRSNLESANLRKANLWQANLQKAKLHPCQRQPETVLNLAV